MRRRFYWLRHVHLVACASSSSRSQDNSGVFQGTPDRARRHAQLRSHPVGRLTSGVELGGLIHLVALQRPAISLGDAMAPDVAEERRPIHLERRRQLLHRDTPTVGGDQLGYLVGCEAPLNRQGRNQRVARANRRLAGTLP